MTAQEKHDFWQERRQQVKEISEKQISLMFEIHHLEFRKQMIITQAIPKFPLGGPLAVIGESGAEMILTESGKIEIRKANNS